MMSARLLTGIVAIMGLLLPGAALAYIDPYEALQQETSLIPPPSGRDVQNSQNPASSTPSQPTIIQPSSQPILVPVVPSPTQASSSPRIVPPAGGSTSSEPLHSGAPMNPQGTGKQPLSDTGPGTWMLAGALLLAGGWVMLRSGKKASV